MSRIFFLAKLSLTKLSPNKVRFFCAFFLRFVTFIWDNNDINPESINGVTMHCTNGIVVQVKSINPGNKNLTENFPLRNKQRKRSFAAIPNELASYISKKRNDPTLCVSEFGKDVMKSLKSSNMVDFLWTLISKFGSKIPNWTGFNNLLHDKGGIESIQMVTYLPAINQSPTNPDTVLELLIQSKEKAEHLGLKETDVVADQAKAVEILSNPNNEDLKSFIVLRLGAFHIALTFITVIGKRFGDAGLKDVLIEANIFGKLVTDTF